MLANRKTLSSVIDTSSNQVLDPPIPVGENPSEVAITPNGAHAYVSIYEDGTVSVIDTATRQVVGWPITVGPRIEFLAVTPDGKRVMVGQFEAGAGLHDRHGDQPGRRQPRRRRRKGRPGIAIVPDQSPSASFTAYGQPAPAFPYASNGSASTDPDGTVAQTGPGPSATGRPPPRPPPRSATPSRSPAVQTVTLTVTDNEGCSVALVFTGATASCHGPGRRPPRPGSQGRLSGGEGQVPVSAEPGGCRFKLKAVARKGKKLKAQSAIARAKVRAGKSAIVSLKPKKKFAKKLAKAKKALVQQVVTIDGEGQTKVSKLKIVQ